MARALGFRFKSNGEVVVRDVERLRARITDPEVIFEDFAEHMLNTSIPENFEQGGRPEKWTRSAWSGENQQKESGRLLRSIASRIGKNKMELGTSLKYARQRHHGGVLKPVRAKALAVPVPGLSRAMRRPKRWGDRLTYIPAKSTGGDTVGVLATSERRGRRGHRRTVYRARFILRKQVTQPARPFLLFQDEDLAYVSRRMVEYVSTGTLR